MTALHGVRIGPVGLRFRLRPLVVPLVALALTVFAVALSIRLGDFPMSVGDVLRVLAGAGDATEQYIVFDLRLPRTLTGLLIGAAFGVAGAITQAISRNPLASPDILGVTPGASAGAVGVIVLASGFGGVASVAGAIGLPVAALIGGLVSAALVYVLAWRRGVDGYRLVLVGIGVQAFMLNLTYWLLTIGDVSQAGQALVWITGSLDARSWADLVPVAVALAVFLPLALVGAHVLGALQFDDDTVRNLGARVELSRFALILIAVMLAAIATAAAGPVFFVALATPQIAQRLAGTARPPLVASAVIGALLVSVSDLVARTAFPIELPVGVVTAVLGAPYLMFLIIRKRREVRA
ncbi:iron chelate uptake ABC transporter family permease subunit [Kutzneria buriramensis]|uniref:Iron complex transport system permease protein n=1 Tax=Kutzneria buriramensis TaxID=1045776 RepID=A0A3E0HV12_9PSEU|nr:iron chelate uptake ABC transporter family permease subunit [Kutzneria buriramensis]REH50241.1 iron complex transport system permease protein [Kutzneria buriramensis]